MSFTYDLSNNIGQVRFYLGDTNIDNYFLTDEDISFSLIENNNNLKFTAADCADAIAAKVAREPRMKKVDNLTVSYQDIYRHYTDLAKKLRSTGARFANPYAGGITLSDKEANIDPNKTIPFFKRGMFTNGDG